MDLYAICSVSAIARQFPAGEEKYRKAEILSYVNQNSFEYKESDEVWAFDGVFSSIKEICLGYTDISEGSFFVNVFLERNNGCAIKTANKVLSDWGNFSNGVELVLIKFNWEYIADIVGVDFDSVSKEKNWKDMLLNLIEEG